MLPYLINGVSVGGQYALIAIGYTLVYGILRLINFAHGDVFMVAGLLMVYLTSFLGGILPPAAVIPAGLLLAVVLTVVLGFVIERAAYKPLREAPRMSVMISAIGVSYLLQNLATYITGGLPQMYPEIPGISKTITIAGVPTKVVTVVTPVLVLVLVVALTQLINHTKIGMAMRAAPAWRRWAPPCISQIIPPSCPSPALCRACGPLWRRCSAASAPFPGPWWGPSSSASPRASSRAPAGASFPTPSPLPC